MPAGRKPVTAPDPAPLTLVDDPRTRPVVKRLVDEAMVAESAEVGRLMLVDNKLALDGPYDRVACVRQIRFLMRRNTEDICEIGRLLVAMKEHEPHGGWLAALEEIDLEPRTAQLMMNAAVRLANPRLEKLRSLNPGRVYALLTLDDAPLECLAEGQTIADLKLDELERLSMSELRARLRSIKGKHQEELDSKERLGNKKSARIEELEAELDKLQHGAPADGAVSLAGQREAEVAAKLGAVALEMMGMVVKFESVIAECMAEPTDARVALAHGTTAWIYHHIWRLSIERGWLLDFRAAADPAWVMQFNTGPGDDAWAYAKDAAEPAQE